MLKLVCFKYCVLVFYLSDVLTIFLYMVFQISIASDKKDSFLYNDKFQNTLFCPTLRHFGGRPTDGFIGVTSSGDNC